jgi:murein DD-endopeptidase MepM/ murein hydrolase activator NlpD
VKVLRAREAIEVAALDRVRDERKLARASGPARLVRVLRSVTLGARLREPLRSTVDRRALRGCVAMLCRSRAAHAAHQREGCEERAELKRAIAHDRRRCTRFVRGRPFGGKVRALSSRPSSWPSLAAALSLALALASRGASALAQDAGGPSAAEETEALSAHEASAQGNGAAQGNGTAPGARAPRTFSNGPRDVPTPRGQNLARMRRLGLGTHAVARQLLFGRPERRWVRAAPGRAPRNFLWPVEGGALWQGFRSMGGRHRALDIGGRCGAPIRAAHGGVVAYSDNGMSGMGNVIILVHPGGWVTAYGHAKKTLVPAGALVRRGQAIAQVGDTGVAYGCHVHFIAYHDGTRLDPQPMMVGAPRTGRGSQRRR